MEAEVERSGTEASTSSEPVTLRTLQALVSFEVGISIRVPSLGYCLNALDNASSARANRHMSKSSGSCKIALGRFCDFFRPFHYARGFSGE